MTLMIKYFGMIAEATQKVDEELNVQYSSVLGLKEDLVNRYPKLIDMNFKIAVNQQIVTDDYSLIGNEEIALLPPFAGG